MYKGQARITNQQEFNQAVSAALYKMYSVSVIAPGTIAAGEPDAEGIRDRADAELRGDLANIQHYAYDELYRVEPPTAEDAPPAT